MTLLVALVLVTKDRFNNVISDCGASKSSCYTLGPAYNEQIDAKKTAHCSRVLIVTELFNIAVIDFDAKKSTRVGGCL